MSVLSKIFTWWTDQTVGTALHTWRKGELVGEDAQGNRYYQEKNPPKGMNAALGKPGTRRWVAYNGDVEASRIPPEWHGWMHYTVDEPPSETGYVTKSWEKEHQNNQTGSANAYHPDGSVLVRGERARGTGDYEAWQPK